MQIGRFDNYRMFQIGTNHSTAWRKEQSQHHPMASDIFGPQCKVTLSREGKKLSRESAQEAPRNFMAASTERLLLREQQQAETNKKESSNMLDEISGLMDSIRNSYSSGEDKETIAKKQDALQRLLDLKARQEQENKQWTEEAAGSAAAASKEQGEIDQKNADLYMLLKSFEEQEDGEEGAGNSSSEATSDEKDTTQKPGSVGDDFAHAASMFGATAAKRELQAKGAIDELRNDGYDKIARANEMMQEIQAELDLAKEAAGKENLSAEERKQLALGHMDTAKGMLLSNYDQIMHLRSSGIQETKDARELDLRHIQINPLDGVNRAKQTILEMGVDAAQNEVTQSTLNKASDELEQRVQEAIDKRNEVVSDPERAEETEKKEEIDAEKQEQEQLEQERLEQEDKKNEFFKN